ncbi:MAG: hypothetical protein DHS20C15_10590 [Planctomycetota bacterium]|nr:MAG: hypothetical protein DHS20C15_10590 [Planctomycetota bacterium]
MPQVDRIWLQRLALRMTGDTHEADDLVQDTWLRLLRQPPPAGANRRGWIATVMANARRNELRGRGRRQAREEAWEREWRAARRGESNGPSTEVVAQVVQAVDALSERDRRVVLLSFQEELSSTEIGEQLGVPPATVRTWRRRAVQSLRRDLDRRNGGDRDAWAPVLLAWAARRPMPVDPGPSAAGLAARWQAPLWTSVLVSLPLVALLFWSPITGAAPTPDVAMTPLSLPATSELVHARPPAYRADEPHPLFDRNGHAAPSRDAPFLPTPVAEDASFLTVRIVDAASGALLPNGVVSFIPHRGRLKLTQADLDARPSLEGSTIHIPRSTLREHAVSAQSKLVDVFVGAPGYAWLRQRWESDATEDHEVRLSPGASLKVRLTTHPSVLEPRLRLAPPDGRPIRQCRLAPGPTANSWSVSWDGLPLGAHRLELRVPDARPSVLEEWSVDLLAGESRELDLTSVVLAHTEPVAQLSGRLTLPKLGDEPPRIRWRRLDAEPAAATSESIAVRVRSEAETHEGALEEWSWSAGNVPLGDYGLAVLPHGLLLQTTVGDSAAPVSAGVSSLATVELHVHDAATGLAIDDLDTLTWRPLEASNSAAASVRRPPLLSGLGQSWRPDAEGRWTLSAAPGLARIGTERLPEFAEHVWYGEREVRLVPGQQTISLAVNRLVVLEFFFEDEGTILPFDGRRGHKLSAHRAPGSPGTIRDHLARRSALAVTPGTLVVRVEDLEGFEPVPPIEVHATPSSPRRVIIPLRRSE